MPAAKFALTPEEHFLWECARHWRDPAALHIPANLEWQRVVETGRRNRMDSLLLRVVEETGTLPALPPDSLATLRHGAARHDYLARKLGDALRTYLHHAAQIGQEVIVLKGLWVAQNVYGDLALRPGGDIDVLLRQADIPAALHILEERMGYGRWWRPLLDDAYYARHHLHQQRCNHDRSIWFEPHWLLDHPYTRLTIDYDALLARTTPGRLLGEPVRDLSRPDLLLTLCVHLVKHAVYLPAVLHRPDLPRLILADGMLMYFLDVAEATRREPAALDWSQLVAIARESGATGIIGAVLHVCHRYLETPVPEPVLNALAPTPAGPLTRRVMHGMAEAALARHEGRQPAGVWAFLTGYRESVIFRPVRLLDLLQYALPGRDYLRRRYGRAGVAIALYHLLRAAGQYTRVGLDTVYYTLKRRLEVRRLDRQGYVWPPQPVDPFAHPAGDVPKSG